VAALLSVTAACSPANRAATVTAAWTLEPAAPVTGETTRVVLRLRDAQGQPVPGAALRIEAHMSHPGMSPVIAPLHDRGGGAYDATLALTMAGRWSLVASGTLPGGGRITATFDVADVK
jgi:hypothetical protein